MSESRTASIVCNFLLNLKTEDVRQICQKKTWLAALGTKRIRPLCASGLLVSILLDPGRKTGQWMLCGGWGGEREKQTLGVLSLRGYARRCAKTVGVSYPVTRKSKAGSFVFDGSQFPPMWSAITVSVTA